MSEGMQTHIFSFGSDPLCLADGIMKWRVSISFLAAMAALTLPAALPFASAAAKPMSSSEPALLADSQIAVEMQNERRRGKASGQASGQAKRQNVPSVQNVVPRAQNIVPQWQMGQGQNRSGVVSPYALPSTGSFFNGGAYRRSDMPYHPYEIASVKVTASEAKSIAMRHAPGSEVLDIKLVNGKTYRVRMIRAGRRFDVMIDANSGRISQ